MAQEVLRVKTRTEATQLAGTRNLLLEQLRAVNVQNLDFAAAALGRAIARHAELKNLAEKVHDSARTAMVLVTQVRSRSAYTSVLAKLCAAAESISTRVVTVADDLERVATFLPKLDTPIPESQPWFSPQEHQTLVATEGKFTGYYQGQPNTGRPIFEFEYNARLWYVAIQIGNNGYIVGANLRSAQHPFRGAHENVSRGASDPNYRGWGYGRP